MDDHALPKRHWGTWSHRRALAVLHALGIQERRVRGDKIDLACPLAEWTHRGGRDEHPSCAVFVDSEGAAYRCLSCGAHGSLVGLVWELGVRRGRYYLAALNVVQDLAPPTAPPPRVLDYNPGGLLRGAARVIDVGAMPRRQLGLDGREAAAPRERLPYVPPPEAEAAAFAAAPMPTYASERGISEATYRRWGLGHDERRRRLVFPVRWPDGRLAGFTARLYWDKEWCYRCGRTLVDAEGKRAHKCPQCGVWYTKYYHTAGMPKGQLLYGAHLHQPGEPVVLVEGPTDAIALAELGVRAPMACLGAAITAAQLALAAQLAGDQPIYACGDGDLAGQRMNAEVVGRFQGTGTRVVPVVLPEDRDPGMATREEARAWGLPVIEDGR
jgi:hypothetical protein